MGRALKIILIICALLFTIFVVLPGAAFLLFLFIGKPVQIAGDAMLPNYKSGQYYMTSKLAYKDSLPQRGDIVTFLMPSDHRTELVKRVVGLPGEKVKIDGGTVYINDQKLDEPYLGDTSTVVGSFVGQNDIQIPEGKYFMMGDNRAYSLDSRSFGFISIKDITGRIWFCYYRCNN